MRVVSKFIEVGEAETTMLEGEPGSGLVAARLTTEGSLV